MNGWDHLSTFVCLISNFEFRLSMFWIHHISLSSLFSSSSSLGSAELLLWVFVASCLRSLYSWIWFIPCFLRSHSVFFPEFLNQRLKFTLWSFELWIKEIKFEGLSFKSKIKFHTLKLWALNQRSKSTLWSLSLFSLHSTLPFRF